MYEMSEPMDLFWVGRENRQEEALVLVYNGFRYRTTILDSY